MRLDNAKWKTGPQRGNLHKRGRFRKIKRSKLKRPLYPIRYIFASLSFCLHLMCLGWGSPSNKSRQRIILTLFLILVSWPQPESQISLCAVAAYVHTWRHTNTHENKHTQSGRMSWFLLTADGGWTLAVFFLSLPLGFKVQVFYFPKGPFHDFMHNLFQLLHIMYALIHNTVNLLLKSCLVKDFTVRFKACHHIIKDIPYFKSCTCMLIKTCCKRVRTCENPFVDCKTWFVHEQHSWITVS